MESTVTESQLQVPGTRSVLCGHHVFIICCQNVNMGDILGKNQCSLWEVQTIVELSPTSCLHFVMIHVSLN